MRSSRKRLRAFSLLELLAIILILGTVAVVAVPQYTDTRVASAARACKANLAALANAEATYAATNGGYATSATIAGSHPENLPVCPLDGRSYTGFAEVNGTKVSITISCPNAARHALAYGVAEDYSRKLPVVAGDGMP
jgi:type II secretory pathway pseudopilin PulG